MNKAGIALLIGLAVPSFAATNVAVSVHEDDVQAAINSSSDGDTVSIPAGSTNWSTQITWDKALHIVGSGINSTIISNDYPTSGPVFISDYDGMGWRSVSEIRFDGRGAGGNAQNVRMEGHGPWVIRDCLFTNVGTAISIFSEEDAINQIVTSNTFWALTPAAEVIQISHSAEGRTNSWDQVDHLGDGRAVYVEGNVFKKLDSAYSSSGGHAVVGTSGTRFVARYNDIEGLDIDAHGDNKQNNIVSTREFEIYGNAFSTPAGKSDDRWIYIRGGHGVVFNNTNQLTGTMSDHGLTMMEFQLSNTNAYLYCGLYPATNQIGMAYGSNIVGVWEWNNTTDGTNVSWSLVDFDAADAVAECGTQNLMTNWFTENIDYFNDQQLSGYASFPYPHPAVASNTVIASSLSYGHVTQAVAQALSGWTVQLPAGSGSYTQAISITTPITIKGAGRTSTLLQNNISEPPTLSFTNQSAAIFDLDWSTGQMALSDLRVSGNATNDANEFRSLAWADWSNTNAFLRMERIDGQDMDYFVYTRQNGNGLMRDCVLTNVDTAAYMIGYNNTSTSNWGFVATNYFGTTNAFYIEDCEFHFTTNRWNYATERSFPVASGSASRWVFRYNIVRSDTNYYQAGMLDHHGNQTGANAVLFSETYGNNIQSPGLFSIFQHRGTQALIFSNVWWSIHEDVMQVGIEFQEEYAIGHAGDGVSGYQGQTVTNTFVWANTITNGTGNAISPLVAGSQWLQVDPDDCTNYIAFGVNVYTTEPSFAYTPLTYPHPLSTTGPGWPTEADSPPNRIWIGVP